MLSFCLAILLIVSCITPVRASEQETIIWYQETELDDGITVIDEVSVQSQTRSASKGYTRRKPFTTDDGIVIAIISIRGEFTYNGTTVSVASKEVTQTTPTRAGVTSRTPSPPPEEPSLWMPS